MRTSKTIYIFAALVITMLFGSCRKEKVDIVNPHHRRVDNYTQQFQTVWTGIDYGYLFWDRDTVDWDARYEEMLPIFQAFDAKGIATDQELEAAYHQLVHGLIDHHMYVEVKNLKTDNSVDADPAKDEVPYRDYYHWTPYNEQAALLESHSGATNYTSGGGNHFVLFPGNNGKKIAYFRFRSFNLTYIAQSDYNTQLPLRMMYGDRPLQGVTNGWAGRDEVEAIIIDVRGNKGGLLVDLPIFIGSLASSRIDIGYSRTKEGLGRLDYSAWTPFIIDPPQNHLGSDKKIVVLADVNSVSCAEITALIIKQLPNGTFIGERTYGATCPLLDGGNDMLYSGVFGDYDKYGYYVYTSNFDLVDKEYRSLEGIGVEPDIECLFDFNALLYGYDNQLERALQFIRTGK